MTTPLLTTDPAATAAAALDDNDDSPSVVAVHTQFLDTIIRSPALNPEAVIKAAAIYVGGLHPEVVVPVMLTALYRAVNYFPAPKEEPDPKKSDEYTLFDAGFRAALGGMLVTPEITERAFTDYLETKAREQL